MTQPENHQPVQTIIVGSGPREFDHRDLKAEKHNLYVAIGALLLALVPFTTDFSTKRLLGEKAGCYVDFAVSFLVTGGAGCYRRYLRNNRERIEVGPCVCPCDPPHQGPPTVPFQGRW